MKVIICVLAALALAQAKPNWSSLRRNNIYVPTKGFNLNSNSRIANGEEAPPHSINYQVAVASSIGSCGGSLISTKTVLTAAHCTDKADEIYITLGAHNIEEEEPDQVEYTSKNFICHEEWDRPSLKNDISLVFLPEEATLNGAIGLVNLPSMMDVGNDFDGYPARVSGWGRTSMEDWGSPVLRYVYTYIISNEKCKERFGGYVKDTNICAMNEKKTACQGDSGGPLVTYTRDEKGERYIQVGVVSYGSAICGDATSSAYTRVTKYLDWIKTNAPEVTID